MVKGVSSDSFGGTEFTPKNGENLGENVGYKNCIFNLNDQDGLVDTNDIDVSNIQIKDKKAQKLLGTIYKFLGENTGKKWTLDLKAELNKLVTKFNIANRELNSVEPKTSDATQNTGTNSKERVEIEPTHEGGTVKRYYNGDLLVKYESLEEGDIYIKTYEYGSNNKLAKSIVTWEQTGRDRISKSTITTEYYEDGVHEKSRESYTIETDTKNNTKTIYTNNEKQRRNGHGEYISDRHEYFDANDKPLDFWEENRKFDENGWRTEYSYEKKHNDYHAKLVHHYSSPTYYYSDSDGKNAQSNFSIDIIEFNDDDIGEHTYSFDREAWLRLPKGSMDDKIKNVVEKLDLRAYYYQQLFRDGYEILYVDQ